MNGNQTAMNDVAERLEVSASTLRTWSEKFGVGGSDKQLYSEREIEIFELIKQLRDDDAGYHTIRRHLESNVAAPVLFK